MCGKIKNNDHPRSFYSVLLNKGTNIRFTCVCVCVVLYFTVSSLFHSEKKRAIILICAIIGSC